jgi:hypothetical protein
MCSRAKVCNCLASNTDKSRRSPPSYLSASSARFANCPFGLTFIAAR